MYESSSSVNALEPHHNMSQRLRHRHQQGRHFHDSVLPCALISRLSHSVCVSQDPVLSTGVAPFWMLLWFVLTLLWIALAALCSLVDWVNPFCYTHLWLLLATIAGARPPPGP